MARLLSPGVANLARAKEVLQLGSLRFTDLAHCIILIRSAVETLFRAYLSSMRHVPRDVRGRALNFHEMNFPQLVEAMEDYGRPPLEEGEELLELNRLRIQVAAHPEKTAGEPNEESNSVDVGYLDSMVKLAERIYDRYANAVQKGWRKIMDMETRLSWVDVFRRSNKLYPSTREQRLVWVKDRLPMKVLPPEGRHFPPLFGVDGVAYVMMAPRRVTTEFAEEVLSRDRVPLKGEAALEVAVIDEDAEIRKVVINSAQEERLVKDSFLVCLQGAAVLRSYGEILSEKSKLIENVASQLARKLETIDSPFKVIQVFLLRLDAADPGFAKIALERAQAEEQSATDLVVLGREQEKQHVEAEMEKERVEHQNHIEDLKDLAKRKRDLERAKIDARMHVEKAISKAKAVKKLGSDEAKLYDYPEHWWRLQELELEVEGKRLDHAFQIAKRQLDRTAAFTAGQADAVRAVLAREQKLTLASGPPPTDAEQSPEALRASAEEEPQANIDREFRELSQICYARWRDDAIVVKLDLGETLTILLSTSGGPPSVSTMQSDETVDVDMSWWEPSSTLADIVRHFTASKEVGDEA